MRCYIRNQGVTNSTPLLSQIFSVQLTVDGHASKVAVGKWKHEYYMEVGLYLKLSHVIMIEKGLTPYVHTLWSFTALTACTMVKASTIVPAVSVGPSSTHMQYYFLNYIS